MKINKLEILIIINVIISQISNTFILSFIENLFLELVEEFLIKILPDYLFCNEPYFNRSFALRIRDLSVYDFSQTNITIWTSLIGAFIFYYINDKMSNKNEKHFSDVFVLLLFYIISIISLIFLLFVPYDETNKESTLKEISNQSMNFKKIIPYFLILISLSISIGTYNLHSIQYITYYFEAYKGLLMPLFIGIACIFKYSIIRGICNIFGENDKEYQSKDNYKLFTILIIIIILICFIFSLIFTYLIEKEIKLIMQQKTEEELLENEDQKYSKKELLKKLEKELEKKLEKELRNLTIKSKPKKFKKDIYKLFCSKDYGEIYYFLLINLLSKLEKIEWKNNINLNLYLLNFNIKRYLIIIFISVSIFFGIIHDKYKFNGFKFFINFGNVINIISCIIYILFYDAINKKLRYKISISFINLFFVGNYYIIMLPELIRRYGTKYILEITGFITLPNIFLRIFENLFIINKLNKTIEIVLLSFQIMFSICNIYLIRTEKIKEKIYDLNLQQLNESVNIVSCVIPINEAGVQNNNNDNDK
jgi:hypothetical protein